MNPHAEPLIRVVPTERKSVEYRIELYQSLSNGDWRGFDVIETYRWGQGFIHADESYRLEDNTVIQCDPELGWGSELDDLISVHVEFMGEFSQHELDEITALCERRETDSEGRTGLEWMFDGDHDWEIEIEEIHIRAPWQTDREAND